MTLPPMPEQTPKHLRPFSIVLPHSGRFAAMRRILGGDVMLALANSRGEPHMVVTQILARITTIDEKPITVNDLLVMDLEDFGPLYQEANERLTKFFGGKGVA